MSKKIKKHIKKCVFSFLIMFSILIGASCIGFTFRYLNIPETNIAIVYLLAVLISTIIIPGYVFGFFVSIMSAFAFNYLFTEPYFTFSSNANSYIITFIIMTITATITSALTSHSKLNERKAHEREEETKALYSLTEQLTFAIDIHDIGKIAAGTVSSIICKQSGCLCFDEKGFPEKMYIKQINSEKQIWCPLENPDIFFNSIQQLNSEYYEGHKYHDWPIHGQETILGTIRIPAQYALVLNKSQKKLLRSIIESIALAMDRFHSTKQRLKLKEETEQERYRSNLLRSISHDLRTPLSGILGSAEMLINMTEQDDCRYKLIEGIEKDANWLYSLVENVLNLTRLQDGKLSLNKQMEAVEEILCSVVNQISRRYPLYDIAVNAPSQMLLVPMDAKLISQVLINLLDNAVKHTSPPGEINITVLKNDELNQAVFIVKDNGTGICNMDIPHVFQMFYTSKSHHTDARLGIGLGLTICETVINAHGGTIQAQNRTDIKGAEFIFTLPLEEK